MPLKRIDTGLSRFDYDLKRDHGYLVGLRRRGVKFVRRFSDNTWGGKREALKAARAWRAEVIAAHPPLSRQQYAQIVRKNNTSGSPGVCAIKNTRGEITGWEAHWLRPGSARYAIRKFATSVYGAARAKQLAVAAREIGVADLAEEAWQREWQAPSAAAGSSPPCRRLFQGNPLS